MINFDEIKNPMILKYLLTTKNKYETFKNIFVSTSGGSDSDIMVDMFAKFDIDKRVTYAYFDTGLEYEATKQHLDCVENKYQIKIVREKAKMPIPSSVSNFGQPFISKHVSRQISTLQNNNFKFEDLPFKELVEKYPRCKGALKWFCNQKPSKNGIDSSFNIDRNKYLREFLLAYPPNFQISNKCCDKSKKDVSKNFEKNKNFDLKVMGMRKSEGGLRATSYKNCFDQNENVANYRPLFFWSDKDKADYKTLFNIKYSDCYEVYGMKRTGCVGCPFNLELFKDLYSIKINEPKLYKAATNVFKDSYAYTMKYKEFRQSYELTKQGCFQTEMGIR